jgi:hypothetical protein
MLALCACQEPKSASETSKPKSAQPPASNRLPTASEVFELRTKCAALGERIRDENFIGSALAQEEVSRYSPEANRCYVRLDVHTADLGTPPEKFISHTYLFDGQTRELLASLTAEGGKQFGQLFDDSLKEMAHDPIGPSSNEVTEIINKFMAEDRRP